MKYRKSKDMMYKIMISHMIKRYFYLSNSDFIFSTLSDIFKLKSTCIGIGKQRLRVYMYMYIM